MTEHIHERLTELLEKEEPNVRQFLREALILAQNPRVSPDGLAVKLQRALANASNGASDED